VSVIFCLPLASFSSGGSTITEKPSPLWSVEVLAASDGSPIPMRARETTASTDPLSSSPMTIVCDIIPSAGIVPGGAGHIESVVSISDCG
jgi:hypothetical protein